MFSVCGALFISTSIGYKVATVDEYREVFHGWGYTDAAAAMIGGVVAALQSMYKLRGYGAIPPIKMRQVLYASGQDPSYPERERGQPIPNIGRMPDMVIAMGLLDESLGPVRKRDDSIFSEE